MQSTIEDDRRYLNLNLFCDDNGLWKYKGILGNGNVTSNVMCPHLLLKEHRFTEVVVIYSHDVVSHNDLSSTLNQLRFKLRFGLFQLKILLKK